MIEDLDAKGANITERVFSAIHYLASKRYGEYPKVLRLNRERYWVFLRYLCLTTYVEVPPYTGDWFLFMGVEIHKKQDRKFYADR